MIEEKQVEASALAAAIEKREQLAALCHEQWSGWMTYLFGRCQERDPLTGGWLMPEEWAKRWARQATTPYAKLSEAEKESDRAEADRVLALLAGVSAEGSEKK